MNKHSELKTIRDYIRYATSCFNESALYYGHGTDNAWDEACALVLHTLHLSHNINPTVLDANLTAAEQVKLIELINLRIQKRIPTPYLTHQAWFCGLPFYVDERVLIPRSSIGELIENSFAPWINEEQIHNILDLCTGSGCIAIACAKLFPQAHVDASDVSQEALAVAKINVLRHGMEDQISLIASDLFNGLPEKKYDLILSNPPYVSRTEMESLPPEYLHEPVLGLSSGETGLDIVVRILQNANKYLQPGGVLIVEVGNTEVGLTEMFPQVAFHWLEFENGEGGVFLLTKEQLESYQEIFENIKINVSAV